MVPLDLMSFVETQILPRYASLGKSHGLAHVQRVIRNSMELARITGANEEMAYVTAAYHDLGMTGPRAIHHLTGGKILAGDARLRRWFSEEQIQVMREAVEDHRASASHQPRSIYGKIVAEADRDIDTDTVFRRAVQYGLEKYGTLDEEAQWQRFRTHMHEKYSRTGYIRLWIPSSPNYERLRQIQIVIDDEARLRHYFDTIYAEETRRI